MDLRFGLTLLGALIVVAVGLTAYDRGRILKRWAGRDRKRRPPGRPQRRGPGANLAPPGDDGSPERIMHEDGSGGRMIYGRRWVAAHGREPPNPAVVPKPKIDRHPMLCVPDETIDFIVRLPGREPAARDQVLALYKQDESLLERPHRLCGLRFGTSISADLETESPGGQYGDLVLSLQLADYRGPATETELNRLSQIGLKLADALHRQPEFSIGFEEALQRASHLDKFCAAYDVIASVNIMANAGDGFTGEAIRDAAVSEGMELGARRIFLVPDPDKAGRLMFSLANLFKPGDFDPDAWSALRTRGLTLFLNVPCVEDPRAVFERMVETAHRLSSKLDGFLLDQDRKPLTDQSIDLIRTQVERIASGMERYNIAPGSVRAIRLFES